MSAAAPKYLAGYPPALVEQVRGLMAQDRLAEVLLRKYPAAHEVRSDRALYDYVLGLKSEYLRSAGPLSKVVFDGKLHVIRQALGTHTSISRVQGTRLKTKREIRVAAVFREMPPEFLRMIVGTSSLTSRSASTTRPSTSCAATWSRPPSARVRPARLPVASRGHRTRVVGVAGRCDVFR